MRGETDRAILDEIALRIDKSIKMIFVQREKKGHLWFKQFDVGLQNCNRTNSRVYTLRVDTLS